MGAVESKAEENSVIRFVDSVEVRHEKGVTIHGNDFVSTDYVPEDKGKGSWNIQSLLWNLQSATDSNFSLNKHCSVACTCCNIKTTGNTTPTFREDILIKLPRLFTAKLSEVIQIYTVGKARYAHAYFNIGQRTAPSFYSLCVVFYIGYTF